MMALCILLAVILRMGVLLGYGNIKINKPKFILTEIVFGFVVLVELTSFFRYVFSDWSRAILLARYSKWRQRKPSTKRTAAALDCLVQVVCTRLAPRTFFVSVPQYTLLHNAAPPKCSSWPARILSLGFLPRKRDKLGKKADRHVPLSLEVKNSVVAALQRLLREPSPQLSNGSTTLRRHDLIDQIGWACSFKLDGKDPEHTAMEPIMVWHVATTFCAMADEFNHPQVKTVPRVATVLSNYCAYLAVLQPELLPQSILSTRLQQKITEETRDFFSTTSAERREMYEKMKKWKGNSEEAPSLATVIQQGCKLGNEIVSAVQDSGKRWEVLEEFWTIERDRNIDGWLGRLGSQSI